METAHYLNQTDLLDFDNLRLTRLTVARGWCDLPESERIGALYDFVRDEIPLGYNASDAIPASRVLQDGYGQCNTKSILLMALMRKCGIACRLHGATVHKRLQKGVITGIAYWLAPREIIHSWVEVFHQGKWISLEGVILDTAYLEALQYRFPEAGDTFCGYAIATSHFKSPPVAWCGKDTAIQKDAIVRDLGVFDAPDDFFARHGANLRGLKALLYKYVFRQLINHRVSSIREAGPVPAGREQRDRAPC
jgi:hypothetical protein